VAGKGGSSDPIVAQILRRKKASIRAAPLPPGAPSWDEIQNERMSEIDRKARHNVPGYKTIKKLLSDRRFDR
jgi:hypothetical protein